MASAVSKISVAAVRRAIDRHTRPIARSVVGRAFSKVSNKISKRPVLAAGASVSMRYILGDCCVQYACDEPWDPVRTLLFASFGFSYASTAGYVVYNRIYALRALATRPVLTAFIDCLTNMPMLYFPAFYVAREFALCTDNRGIEDPLAVAKSGLARARGNLGEDIIMGGAFWFPFHIVNFTLFPIHLRQPVMAVVGFGWATLLSLVRGNLSSEDTNKDNVGYRVAALSKEGYQTLLSPALCEEDRDPDLVALLNR